MKKATRESDRQLPSKAVVSGRLRELIQILVQGRISGCITGKIGSGKSFTLREILSFLPNDVRTLLVEERKELYLKETYPDKRIIELAYNRTTDDEYPSTHMTLSLLQNGLVLRPHRYVVGEVQGEEIVLLSELLRDHGGWTTLPGETIQHGFQRLIEIYTRFRLFPDHGEQLGTVLADAIDVMLLQEEDDFSGIRTITQVSEIIGYEENQVILNTLYELSSEGEFFGNMSPSLTKKLYLSGISVSKIKPFSSKAGLVSIGTLANREVFL